MDELMGPGASTGTLIKVAQAGYMAVTAQALKEKHKDARHYNKKARKKEQAVLAYLQSDSAASNFDPAHLAELMDSANKANRRRERAQNEAIDESHKVLLASAVASFGVTLIEMNGQMGYMNSQGLFVAIAGGLAGWAIASISDDKDDDEDDDE